MRLRDFQDYFRLRKLIEEPWRFLRLRKRRTAPPLLEIRFRQGFSVFIRPCTFDRQFFNRIFARDEYRLEPLSKRPCECIVDVGGQIGLFAVRASFVAKRVLTFEPMAENFALLQRNLSAARFGHVRAVRAAVTDRSGTMTLHRSAFTGHHSLYMKPAAALRKGTEHVPALSLEQLFHDNDVKHCDLLKLDCEGAEYPILYTAPDEVLRKIARIHMEYHGVDGSQPRWCGEELKRFLEGTGYTVDFLPSRRPPGRGHMFCWR